MNSFQVAGKLYRDAVVVTPPSGGKSFLRFSVAYPDPFDRKVQLYADVKLYGEKRIEPLAKMLVRGVVVAVSGRFRNWVSGEGKERKYGIDFLADDVDILVYADRNETASDEDGGEEPAMPSGGEDEFPF